VRQKNTQEKRREQVIAPACYGTWSTDEALGRLPLVQGERVEMRVMVGKGGRKADGGRGYGEVE
jgi:hypothetical protein